MTSPSRMSTIHLYVMKFIRLKNYFEIIIFASKINRSIDKSRRVKPSASTYRLRRRRWAGFTARKRSTSSVVFARRRRLHPWWPQTLTPGAKSTCSRAEATRRRLPASTIPTTRPRPWPRARGSSTRTRLRRQGRLRRPAVLSGSTRSTTPATTDHQSPITTLTPRTTARQLTFTSTTSPRLDPSQWARARGSSSIHQEGSKISWPPSPKARYFCNQVFLEIIRSKFLIENFFFFSTKFTSTRDTRKRLKRR